MYVVISQTEQIKYASRLQFVSLHSRESLSQAEGRNEDAGVKGGIFFGADIEMEDERIGIREY